MAAAKQMSKQISNHLSSRLTAKPAAKRPNSVIGSAATVTQNDLLISSTQFASIIESTYQSFESTNRISNCTTKLPKKNQSYVNSTTKI